MQQMLDEKISKQISDIFSKLHEPVGILFFGSTEQNCEYCEETLQLLNEVTGLSEKIYFEAHNIDEESDLASDLSIENVPAICIGTWDGGKYTDYGIRYFGIPAGHEFTSLIRDVLMVSNRESGLSKETKDFLATLDRPLQLQVFVTPTCPYCPQAVILAHQLAFESSMVEGHMVEAIEFPELSDQYGVSGVPHTIINEGAGELVGAVPEAVLIQKIMQVVEDEAL